MKRLLQIKIPVANNNKGMTLIEIMIVMVILGGLMATLGTKVMDNFAKSKVKQANISMAEMGKALETYYMDCNSYPDELAGLQTAPSNCSSWGPTAYHKIKQDPWNNDYQYEADGGSYTITSLGADRSEGGEGYDADIQFPAADEDDE